MTIAQNPETAADVQAEPFQAPRTHPCECSYWWAADTGEDKVINTNCGGFQVPRMFAQGHDAKLKSLLIQAGVRGLQVHDGRGLAGDAAHLADRFTWAPKVRQAIKTRLQQQADRDRAAVRRAVDGHAKAVAQQQRADSAAARWPDDEVIDRLVQQHADSAADAAPIGNPPETGPVAPRQVTKKTAAGASRGDKRAAALQQRMQALATNRPTATTSATVQQMIDAVQEHALAHYETEPHWDVVIETMTEQDIATVVGGCTTTDGAIRKMNKHLTTYADYK